MRGIDALPVFPASAKARPNGHLEIGGLDAVELARAQGTPLYVFDEEELRDSARRFRSALDVHYPGESSIIYASKAFSNVALFRLLAEEGVGFDVVSGGELATTQAAGVDPANVHFHGNNKSEEELQRAVESGIGAIVVDNLHELALLESILERFGKTQQVSFRVSPGVDPHTHAHTTTGVLDSKFGLAIQTGQAEEAIARAMQSPRLDVAGLHFHLGSPIFELEPYEEAIQITMEFAAQMRDKYGFSLRMFSPGGGFAVNYLTTDEAPVPDTYISTISKAIIQGCDVHGLELPAISIEPGRSMVGTAGVALYTVGATKLLPDIRTYVSVDGGMGDNIRPAIYGSQYEAVLASRMADTEEITVTIAGKYCESGDILVRDCSLPTPAAGDILAIPVSGAYCIAMSSTYNANPRPEVVLVSNGEVRTIRRRETFEDLMRLDV
ncbi:MAG: diaminopimelate decarboxylase [Dehalococcoidia bacterium]|nr:diaminopimelate decarboxylase [Dehalococcoidia bacterium]